VQYFAASAEWFEHLKGCNGFYNLPQRGEAAATDLVAAEKFSVLLQVTIERYGYLPQQVFGVDEMGLFWKCALSKMLFSVSDKVASGFKATKNCVTLLFDGNASGDYKIKLLMIYYPENCRALKGYLKWICLFYGNLIRNLGLQQVSVYVPFTILLLLHNALGHLPRISVTDEEINVMLQHPNITFLLYCLHPVAYCYIVLL
jgi:hypothetical protein